MELQANSGNQLQFSHKKKKPSHTSQAKD